LALQPQWALAYLHETLRFTSVKLALTGERNKISPFAMVMPLCGENIIITIIIIILLLA
jgi:hypothetical protein